MMDEPVKVTREGKVLVVVLDRPKVNAIDKHVFTYRVIPRLFSNIVNLLTKDGVDQPEHILRSFLIHRIADPGKETDNCMEKIPLVFVIPGVIHHLFRPPEYLFL